LCRMSHVPSSRIPVRMPYLDIVVSHLLQLDDKDVLG
jgi:hypothetical protein